MTEANVEPARIGKLNGSTPDDNAPVPDIEKKIEKEYDSNSAPQESLKVNEAESKHEKPNEDAEPASNEILKTNGSADQEVVLGKKNEEENGRSVDEEGSEGKREKEDWGLQLVEVDHGKLQVPSDAKDHENVAQSDELEVNGVVEVKSCVETKSSGATGEFDIIEDAKMLEAEDMKKEEDMEASNAEKPDDDSTAKTEDVKTSEAEDTKISEASPKISDMAKTKDAEISVEVDTIISGARNTEMTEPQDAKISEMEDAERSGCKGSDDNMAKAEDSKSKDVDKTLAGDVEMLDHIQDVKMAENDSKTLDPGNVIFMEVNYTKAPHFEEIKYRMEKEAEVSHANVGEKAQVRNENMTKSEDVEISGTEYVQDLTELVLPESGDTKPSEANVAILVEAEVAKALEVEETQDKQEIIGGTQEKNGKALDIQSAGKEETTNKAQDEKVVASEHLKDKESLEIEDKDMVKLTEEGVKTTGSEGIKEEKEVEGEDEEEGVKGKNEERSGEARGSKKKRSRGQRSTKKDDEKEKKDAGRKQKEGIGSPGLSSSERPVREKKSVERLVEVLEKEQEQAKTFTIEKGRGTPLKDIPNVARKIARKKPADLKFLHQTLFGRVGKAVDYKIHILQFSGFTWHETEEKQRTKIKEKLDKCVKDTLLDLCDLFNIAVSRATVRKEDLVAVLLDFIAAPHPILRASLDDNEQQSAKSRKRKRVDTKRAKQSTAKIAKSENTRKTKYDSDFGSDEDEEDRTNDKGLSSEDEEEVKHSENDTEELASGAEDESDDEFSKTSDQKTKVSSRTKRGDSAERSKASSPKKAVLVSTVKSPTKISGSHKKPEANENSGGLKVFSRVKRNTDSRKKKSNVPKLDYEEKAPEAKREAKNKPGSKKTKESGPSDEDLRKTMQEILKEVDFNTATFTDIFKQLESYYKTDLAARKASLKLILQEELTKLAEEAEDSEDDDEGGSEDDKGRGKRKKIVKV